MIYEAVFMKNNDATFSTAKASSSGAHAGQSSLSKMFYEQVRSDFLKQSARYLHDSFTSRRVISNAVNKKLF